MRFIVYGAGAIGAVIGAALQQAGYEVALIARGEHAVALRERGLRVESHAGVAQLQVRVVEHPRELELDSARDIVILAMKTQHLEAALNELAAVAPADLPVACAQNGVEAERLALRRFTRVQAISVMVPAVYLEPGVVQVFGTPLFGVLDVGRYPSGRDAISEALSAAFRAASFGSDVRDDIQVSKYSKLIANLGNSIEALSGPEGRKGRVAELVREEAFQVLRAAGIAIDLDAASRRSALVVPKPLGEAPRPGGSSWQSLSRGTGNIETDYLNGEIALLGRLTGIPTPANQLLQRLANEHARAYRAPGSVPLEALTRLVDQVRATA